MELEVGNEPWGVGYCSKELILNYLNFLMLVLEALIHTGQAYSNRGLMIVLYINMAELNGMELFLCINGFNCSNFVLA